MATLMQPWSRAADQTLLIFLRVGMTVAVIPDG